MLLTGLDAKAASTPPTENKQPEPGQKQIEYSASKIVNEKRARALKTSGDFNFDQNDPELAATFYLRALALAPTVFTVDEKKQIANRLAAAHHQKEAIEVLRQLAIEHGEDNEIRVSLAKLFSATENYTAAIAEVDKVLKQDRGNKYALLVKANSLRSQQKFGESAALYRRILEKGDDFDARLGLTYSLLAMGEKTKARDAFARLKYDGDEQEEQAGELKYYLESVTRPTTDLYSARFTDSDRNVTTDRRVTIRGTGTDWDLSATYGRKSALSEGVTYTANSLVGSASANFSEVLRLVLKAGEVKMGADTLKSFSTGEVSGDLKLGLQPISILNVSYSREPFTTTGSSILHGIEQDQTAVKYTREISANSTLFLNYHYKQYSDMNSATDFQGSVNYTLLRIPFVRVGYVYRHMNYERTALHGYFDPQNYTSNQAFVTFYYEYAPFYFDSEIDYGRQIYDRGSYDAINDYLVTSNHREQFMYASATIGASASQRLHFELHAEYNGSRTPAQGLIYHDLLVSAQVSYMF